MRRTTGNEIAHAFGSEQVKKKRRERTTGHFTSDNETKGKTLPAEVNNNEKREKRKSSRNGGSAL